MRLTEHERQTLRSGKLLRATDTESQIECVVLRADVYERIKVVLEGAVSPEAISKMVDETMAEYDSGDPLLEFYQQYRP